MDDKDLMCVARILQSVLFENKMGIVFYGCIFCDNAVECAQLFYKTGNVHFDSVRKTLQDITGVDLGYHYNRNNPEAKFRGVTIRDSEMPAE